MLDEILEKCKSHGDKIGLRYINQIETPTSRDIIFIKGKEETPNQATLLYFAHSFLFCTHFKKFGHTQNRCHTRFLEKYESQLNRPVNDFNSLKNNILNTKKRKKTNPKPKTQQISLKSPPKVNKLR